MKKLITLCLVAISMSAFSQSNITVSKTVPLFYKVNKTMYPDAPDSICYAHEFTFSGLGTYCCAQVWIYDPSTTYFRQMTVQGTFVNNSFVLQNYQTGITTGKLCLLLSTDLSTTATRVKSNIFSYTVSDFTIVGGSMNLGPAPYPFTIAEALSTPSAPPLPSPTPPKGKNKVH